MRIAYIYLMKDDRIASARSPPVMLRTGTTSIHLGTSAGRWRTDPVG